MPDETRKTCPKCGGQMEEFAIAWGWERCFDCGIRLASKIFLDEREER